MGNNNYEVGFKDAMVRKMMGPPAMSATALAGELGSRKPPSLAGSRTMVGWQQREAI